MEIIIFMCVGAYIIIKLGKEKLEPTQPAGGFQNKELMRKDSIDVSMGRMSQKQFNKNIKNGKYR